MEKHFCTCQVESCPRHPINHESGCNFCIKDNLLKKKIPACFFLLISKNVDELKNYSIESFIEFYEKNKNKLKKIF